MKEIFDLKDCKLITTSSFYEIEETMVSFVLERSNENGMIFLGFTDCVFYRSYNRSEFLKQIEDGNISIVEDGFYHLECSQHNIFSSGIENIFSNEQLNAYALIFKETCYVIFATSWGVEKHEGLPYIVTYFNEQISKHFDDFI